MSSPTPSVFRFAPSPNGHLHLGHAYSALLNQAQCMSLGGRLLLRLEDIDLTRCTPQLEKDLLEDLQWLGIDWTGEPWRQSEHFDDYEQALQTLSEEGLVYRAFMTRGQIKDAVKQLTKSGTTWPCDPDGSPLYPGDEKNWSTQKVQTQMAEQPAHVWRLNMSAAISHVKGHLNGDIAWIESGVSAKTGLHINDDVRDVLAKPEDWGDVILARSDTPTSYHLSVTLDDAKQGVTHVVRGYDLYHATSVHRLLQTLLGMPAPVYHHHNLILDKSGRKLSKSSKDTSLRALRNAGVSVAEIKQQIGLN